MSEMQKLKVSSLPRFEQKKTELTLNTGFTTDIGAKASDLNLAVSLFFITFVIFQPISSAVGRRIGAKHWIPIIMVLLQF
jgi:MFS family permease